MRKILLLGGIVLSAVLIWFTVNYSLSARPLAEENLRGLALSLASAIESIALQDPSLQTLAKFSSHDIAFFALIDRNGIYRFHTNPDLIGKSLQGALPLLTLNKGETFNERISLRTGEVAFEFNAPLYLPGEALALRLTLHTYRADAVVRRAKLNMIVSLGLLAAGWGLALALYRNTRREEQRKLAMAHRESLAQLGEMGAMLAHEIRNPLAGIKGYAQVIEKKPQDERNSGFAQRIVAETQRMEALVNDLLTYARCNQESMVTVDLGEIVKHAADLLRQEAAQFKIDVSSECPSGILLSVNRDQLEQVLLNVGKNAIQAMPDGGTLKITAAAVGNQLIINVFDDGQGIRPEEIARIFEPFFTTRARGTGLGLALCKKIVEEHGGKITVQSTVGQGTTVIISIPRQ